MDCIGAARKLLVRLGVLPSFTVNAVKDAETENLVVDRERTMEKLAQATEQFREKSQSLASLVEGRTGEVQKVLGHIRNMGSSADARILIEDIMMKRHRGD